MNRIIWIFYMFASILWAQTTPQQGLSENIPAVFVYKNAQIIISAQSHKKFNTIIIKDGLIEMVGNNLAIPPGAKVIDLKGSHIYPGFIEPFCNYGLPETKKPEETEGPNPDIKRIGEIYWNAAVKPQRAASEEFQADEKTAKEFIEQGFAITQINAIDGFFSGSSAVVLLNTGLSNKLIVKDHSTQFLSFSRGSSNQDYPTSLMGAIALIRQAFYDAQWYGKAWQAYDNNPAQIRPEKNISLNALDEILDKKIPVIFDAGNHLNVIRASKIAEEFGLKFVYRANSDAYRRINDIQKCNSSLIIPVNFPDIPDIASADNDADVSLAQLKYWDTAPENPARLHKAGIDFAFTTFGLKDKSDFLKNVRIAVRRGLDKQYALKALTEIPAKMAGISDVAGTLEKGKLASFIVCDKDIFDDDAIIEKVVIEKVTHDVNPEPENDFRGKWLIKIENQNILDKELTLSISGKFNDLKSHILVNNIKFKTSNFSVKEHQITFNFSGDTLNIAGIFRFNGLIENNSGASGKVVFPDGKRYRWIAKKKEGLTEKAKENKETPAVSTSFPVTYPDEAYGRLTPPVQPDVVAITNATIWTAAKEGILEDADIIIKKGKISAIGKNLSIPEDALKIDGTGMHVTPGIIDEHTHIAISGHVNEAGQAVTSEVRIGDVVNPESIQIYRQLAGGVTTTHLLHGSANPIGGQCQVIKLRWGENAEGLKYKRAAPTIKFALGENVKQSNWGDKYTKRYPQTRMGVREIMWDSFKRAKEYEAGQKAYNDLSSSEQKRTIPPRRDLELDALVEVLNGKRIIHCHSYVQSEVLMLIRLAEEYGFRVGTFTHILEGYKVAREMQEHGAMASTFSDWWDYKFEVYEAIPYNTTLMANQGIVTSVNSDDAEMARRLNQEAAKAIKYGDLPRDEAIKLVTINSARQLKIDQYTGSLEVGKDADFVIWNDDPLSIYARPEQTWIEGRKYFDIKEDKILWQQLQDQKAALIQKALSSPKDTKKTTINIPDEPEDDYNCDDTGIYTGGME